MPVHVSYPGVYIEEKPSGVRTIVGVATSIAAFVDFFAQGPMNEAKRVLSFADFERQFGGLDRRSEASYAIQQFFLNGGSEAFVVRTASVPEPSPAPAAPPPGPAAPPPAPAAPATPAPATAAKAAISLKDNAGTAATPVLTATASSEGDWGNNVRIDVDWTADPTDATKILFNMSITKVDTVQGKQQVVATETFRNLVIDPAQPNDAMAVVNAGSKLITLKEESGNTGKRPAMTGSMSKGIKKGDPFPSIAVTDTMDVTLGAGGTKVTTGSITTTQTTLAGLASALQGLIRNADKTHLGNATVSVVGSASSITWLVVKAGTNNPADFLKLEGSIASTLGFVDAARQNVQRYALGGDAAQAQALPGDGTPARKNGSDGDWDPKGNGAGDVARGIIGDPNSKTGIYALLDVDLFNILCLPVTAYLPDPSAAAVATAAEKLCSDRRAMYILDVPQTTKVRDTVDAVMEWLDANASLRNKNAALYFPRVDIPDPLNDFRLRPAPPSGTIAGLFARIDGSRGVWKAPAGTEATLAGVQKQEYKLTDGENGVLNPLAINCLRIFPIYGPVCWGARTLNGADQLADEYKYIPVRRLALFIEESLFRGTQWVVFEPNDEPLWAQIRLNVGAFMQNLFRQGAFQGNTPQAAYFVECDKVTNPQNQIDLGIVNIVVGFAPLKPAEFVIIQIRQIAGLIAT